MPKQYDILTNFYDYYTIKHAKTISNKETLRFYIYYRWKQKTEFLNEYVTTLNEKSIRNAEYPIIKKDRRKYCLTDAKAEKTELHLWEGIKNDLLKLYDIAKQAKHQEEIVKCKGKLKNIKSISIPRIDKMLEKILNRHSYNYYQSLPTMKRDVLLTFSVQDSLDRSEEESLSLLTSCLNLLLQSTNWRLETLKYRLGIITGVLKVYENDEEMLALLIAESTKVFG